MEARSLVLEGPASEAPPADGGEGEGDVVGALGYAALAGRIRSSAATTAEVRAACADLQVLGRSEFKALLKWCAALAMFRAPPTNSSVWNRFA